MIVIAEFNWSIEPAWPWSMPNVGIPAMIAVAGLLALLTVWTYVGVRKATWRRILGVLSLRLAALLLAFAMMLRPSLGTVHPEGVETSKLLAVFDVSESMNVADVSGKPTRWQQVSALWSSRNVQRRLEELATEQKIEVVKYLAAENLRPDAPDAAATGKRTDMGLWLHQLWQKHGHEKRLRGIAIFSDGGDNGRQFSVLQEARPWRGIAPIHTFGAGSPDNAKLSKDIALTNLNVTEPTPITVKSVMKINAIVQAPGFKGADVDVSLRMQKIGAKEPEILLTELKKFRITKEKDQKITMTAAAPEQHGEYKLTMKIAPHLDESNKDNNEISTIVQVIRERLKVLWVDRPRFYEPTFAIRALKLDQRFDVYHSFPAPNGTDPIKEYELDKHFDVIVIGDISAQRFCAGKPEVFSKIKEMVETKGTGLLMLGGTEAFGNGGWGEHRAIVDLMPVAFVKKEFATAPVTVMPTQDGATYPFLKLNTDPKQKDEPWKSQFEPLDGLAPLGKVHQGDTELAKTKKGEVVLAAGRRGKGRVAVFAGDTTWRAWLRSKEAAPSYARFWQQLVFWLAEQEDHANLVRIELPRRRVATSEPLGFTFWMRDKTGRMLPNARFNAEVIGPGQKQFPVAFQRGDRDKQQGTFAGAKESGEYQLKIHGEGTDLAGQPLSDDDSAHFWVDFEDVEMARPAADHELLNKIASAGGGRFHLAEEQALLQYLDEIKSQVNGESRLRTTHWPDWKRLPPSDGLRDQLTGLWQSFALGGFVLFVLLLGTEWSLRRWWGWV